MMGIEDIKVLAHKMRLDIVNATNATGSHGAHVGGSLSCVEILATLYSNFINLQCENFDERDRFILSKGHAALALYSVLKEISVITEEDFESFEMNGSLFVAHAKRNIKKGLEFSGGSLSLGLSFAAGVAYACKQKGYHNRVYVLLGDGECNEGLIWEALMFASFQKLSNMTVIVDHNHLQADGFIEDVLDTSSLNAKFESFGFSTSQVNGHDISELMDSFNRKTDDRPKAIIAETIKGKGISFVENKYNWHHGTLTGSKFTRAINEIENEKL